MTSHLREDGNSLPERTRQVYSAQHRRLAADEAARAIHAMYTAEYFRIPNGWLDGKRAVDVGCGDTAVLTTRLLQLGCAHVTALDIGSEWMGTARRELEREGLDPSRYTLLEGNVLTLPLASGDFDLVACNGVLVHLADLAEVGRGFAECVRVCRSGGYFYSSYGTYGGLVEGVLFPRDA